MALGVRVILMIVWKDQMIRCTYGNGTEQSCSYDGAGNPTVYKGLDLTWADGRKLEKVERNNTLLASYTYDQSGNRITKQTADTGVDYHLDGGKILAMRRNNEVVNFIYDEKVSILAMEVISSSQNNQGMYYYQKNLQGDVTGLFDSNGNQMVSYTYDSWGKPYSVTGTKAATLGVLNPFRYRGYVYDEETGWYYLKSRYYDPEMGRFLNANSIIPGTKMSVQGYNLYSYCQNDPVNMEDTEGMTPHRCGPFKSASYYVNQKAITSSNVDILNSTKSTDGYEFSKNSLPAKGEPGTSDILRNPDGTPKQKRWYGPDGDAERDRDYNHTGENLPFPHDHVWNKGKRGTEHLPPSPDYEFKTKPFIAGVIARLSVIGVIIVVADNITGIGVADDVLLVPLMAGIGAGVTIVD